MVLSGGCYQTSREQRPPIVAVAQLNSERIEQRFGSYGVELLRQDAELRVSNLYSTDASERTCRTLAVVRFATPLAAELAAAHAEILAGGSIGSVLRGHGWLVKKRRLRLHQIDISTHSAAAKLMNLSGPVSLATDLYQLTAQRGETSLAYALIAEIHHPDYFTLSQLSNLPVDLVKAHDPSPMLQLAEAIATAPP